MFTIVNNSRRTRNIKEDVIIAVRIHGEDSNTRRLDLWPTRKINNIITLVGQ